jgi:hypothetical protein
MTCSFGISRYPEHPRRQADILGSQKAEEHGEESGNIPGVERKLLPKNFSNGIIQCGYVLNGRYLRFNFVSKHIKPETIGFQNVSFLLYPSLTRLSFFPLHIDKVLSATQARIL